MQNSTFGPRIQYVKAFFLIILTSFLWTGAGLYAQDITVVSIPPTCADASDGSIEISVSGGTAPYSYSWNGPNVNTDTSSEINNLVVGSYTVTVTDANSATSQELIELDYEDVIDPNAIAQDIIVQLDNNGSASITATDVDNGSYDNCAVANLSLDITNFDCSDVGVNQVTLTVTDVNNKTSTATATVTVEDMIAPNAIAQDITVQLDNAGNASIAEDAVNNGSSDACGGLTFDTDITDFDCSDVGSNTVILTVTDVNGQTDTASATVTVEDNVAPNAIAQDISIQLDNAGNASITPSEIDNGSTDNCAIDNLSLDISVFDCSDVGSNTVILTVTDVNGQTDTETATVTVEDNVVPNAIAQDISIQLDNTGNASITPSEIDNGSTDNCAIDNLSLDISVFDCSDVGSNTVILTVTDVNGQTDTATATVTVEDNVVPNAIAQDISIQLDNAGNASITPSEIDNGSTDNCAIDNLSLDKIDFDCSNLGANTVTLTVTDVNGNSDSKTATVMVEDNLEPLVITKDITIELDASGNANIAEDQVDNGSSDNCGNITFDTDVTSFNCTDVGSNTVTLTVTDANGNSDTATATVKVEDNILPVINTVSPITSNSSEVNCYVRLTITNPGATDNCQVPAPTGTRGDGLSLSDPFPIGTTVITWNVVDENGQTAEPVMQSVIVEDNTAPVIDHNGDKNVFNDVDTCGAIVNVIATASDNCNVDEPVGTRDDNLPLSDPFPVGTTNILWNVVDEYGNPALEQAQVITVSDNQKPVVPVLDEINAECSITLTPPTTSDNCDAVVTGTTGVDLTIEESTSVFWVFTDSAGNSTASVEQVVTIADTQAPVPDVTTLPRKSITGCQISSIDELDIPTATDACDGTIQGTLGSDFEFPYSFFGINTVVWEFADESGNVFTQQQEIQLNPIAIDGGTLEGEFDGTTFPEQIDISSCGTQISIDLTLSGKTGTIIHWEKFAVNEGFWEVINTNSTNYTANFSAGAFESTYFRVLVQNGTCSEYSNSYFVRALPAGDAPTVTNLDEVQKYCLGDEVNLLAESNYLATQPAIPAESPGDFNEGQLNTQDPDSWLTDGAPGGFTAGGNSKKVRNWSGTNDHKFGNITYDGGDKKFAIAQGDFFATESGNGNGGGNAYTGNIPTTLESPIVDLSNAASASLDFDQAFYFANNDVALIEISTDGGDTYSNLRVMHDAGTGILKWLTAGTAESTAGSNATNYNFSTDNTSISLDDYIGESSVRIRWSFTGTSDQSVWAMDNIFINNEVPVDTELEWTNGIGNPDESPIEQGQTSIPLNFIPQSPGLHQYGATALINNCRTYDEDGTDLINIPVTYSYAGEDIIYSEGECGQNTVILNAYNNALSANENFSKEAYPTKPEVCLTCDAPGTQEIGTWTWSGEESTCEGVEFSDVNDPNSTFTAGPGTYTLTWTVDDCSDDVIVTISNCDKIDFDGTNDHVDFGDNYDLDGAFSIEVWVKPETLTGNRTIFSKRHSSYSGSAPGYDLRITNETVSFNWNDTGSISSPHKITDNSRWYHIALTHTFTGDYKLYIDGILMKNTGGGAPASNNYSFILGAMDSQESQEADNFFHGWMEELRIWNVALTKEQIQLMMNQHIEKESDSKVAGEIIPVPTGLNWNDLAAYYRMDNISCGNLNAYSTDGTDFKGESGRLINIASSQQATAPLPYESNSNGNWDTMSTWLYPDVWDAPNSKGINNDLIDWNIVVTNHDIVSSNRNINLLALVSENGILELEGSVNMNTGKGTGNGLLISHYLKLDGVVDLNGESQLIQPEASIIDSESTGHLEVDQQGVANSFNYNYWTSPVSNIDTPNLNSGFSLESILYNGSSPFTFKDHFAAADNVNEVVLSSYWLYTFSGDADDYFTWLQFDEAFKLEPGIGYSMKGTRGYVPLQEKQNYTFRGMPHNGDISVSVGANQNLLTGNPYPSAIDSEQFIDENAIQNQNFNGSLYFWDHFGEMNTHYLEEYVGGYAVLNKSGSVSSASSIDSRIETETDLRGSKKPGRYIPVGQGFFINTQGASNPQQITFKNKYRVFVPESSGDSQFHTQEDLKPKKGEDQNTYKKDSRYKIRLKFESPKGYHRQILVTADANTTNGFDLGYDAPLIENNVEDMYWLLGDTEFVIQAVPNFNLDQVLKLGIKIAEPGEYKIKVDEFENLKKDFIVYLKDLKNEEYYNLSEGDFIVTAEETGFFNDLYEIVFRKPVIEEPDTEKPETNLNDPLLSLDYLKETDEIAVLNPDLMQVDFVELYSLSGQKIQTFSEVPTERSVLLKVGQKLSSAVYIVKVFSGERSYSKKVIITK